jgi:hypothetical protein
MMDALTWLVAVAVQAIIGAPGKSLRSPPSARYAGLRARPCRAESQGVFSCMLSSSKTCLPQNICIGGPIT